MKCVIYRLEISKGIYRYGVDSEFSREGMEVEFTKNEIRILKQALKAYNRCQEMLHIVYDKNERHALLQKIVDESQGMGLYED